MLSVFAVGYLSTTIDRIDKHNAPDAPGEKLRVTHGKILDFTKDLRRIGENKDSLNYAKNAVFITDADGSPGMSGGPFLNNEGKVIGIYSRQQSDAVEPSRILTHAVKAKHISILPKQRRSLGK